MAQLAGKTAIVTGASKGIGAGIAKALAAAGASVVVNYAGSKEGADAVVREIVARDGKAIAVQGDVAKAEDVKRLFAEAKRAFGAPSILVNNAGVYHFQALGEITEAEFHRQFDTNVLGLLLATQEAAKHFEGGGSIINISSIAATNAVPDTAVYSATKAAVDSITRVLSRELGSRQIRVNAISPGPTETEGTHAIGVFESDFGKQLVASTPLGRAGQPSDIAPAAVFLASDAGSWITGESIRVSGGAT
ncbi:MAG TPA: glucose 1-dehydrogenase [Polyangiaceae bacterium]|nr:glucose 1-dehydrogenase [Polyangiaceae bacterium]